MTRSMDYLPSQRRRQPETARDKAGFSRTINPLLLDPSDYKSAQMAEMPPGILPELAEPHGRPAPASRTSSNKPRR